MSKSRLSLVVGFIVMGTSSIALAQVSNTQTGATPGATPSAQAEITLTGNITSSVTLNVTSALLSLVDNTGTPSIATVDFGNFSTTNPTAASASIETRNAADDGAIIGVDLSAEVLFSGAAGATLIVQRANAIGAGDVADNNLRIGADGTAWTDNTDGSEIDVPAGVDVDLCNLIAAGACTSGTAYDHEVTVHLPDSTGAGVFTTVVEYLATIN